MLTSTIRPIARQAIRQYSTRPAASGGSSAAFNFRNAVIGGSALLAVGGSLVYSRQNQKVLLDDAPSARKSVLDLPSLKESIHKR